MSVKWSAFPAGAAIGSSDIIVGLQSGNNVQWTYSQLSSFIGLNIGSTAISGGTSGSFLYDNAGIVGETAGMSWNNSTQAASISVAANATPVTISGYSLSGANAQPMLNLSGTWNTTGTPTAIKLNMLNTASNSASLLMDLQAGGTSVFNMNVGGSAFRFSTSANAGIWMIPGIGGDGRAAFSRDGTTSNISLYIGEGSITAGGTAVVGLSFSTNPGISGSDIFLARDGANLLALRNGTTGQTFRIYETTDLGLANYSRLVSSYVSANSQFEILTEAAGTGTQRPITIRGNGLIFNSASGFVTSFNHIVFGVDNSLNIGSNGSSRPANVYAGSDIVGNRLLVPTNSQAGIRAGGTANTLNFFNNGGGQGVNVFIPTNDTWQWGNQDGATPTAQTMQAQSAATGNSNVAGVDWTFNASRGTGSGAGGRFVFAAAQAGSSGTTQNAVVTIWRLSNLGSNTIMDSPGGISVFRAASGGAFYFQNTTDGTISGASNFITSSDNNSFVIGTQNTARVSITASGNFVTNSNILCGGNIYFGTSGTISLISSATDGTIILSNAAATHQSFISIPVSNTIQLGQLDIFATATAQTLQVNSVQGGAGNNNVAGADWTFVGSRSTGSGAGGRILFQTSPAGAAGAAQNAATTRFVIASATGPIITTNSNALNFSTDGAGTAFDLRLYRSGTAGWFTVDDNAGNSVNFGCPGINGLLKSSGALGTSAPTTQTGATYSMGNTDSSIIANNNAGTLTITLLAASGQTGRWLYIKTIQNQTVVSASSNVVPRTTNTAGTAILAATAGAWAALQSDGTNWIIMAGS